MAIFVKCNYFENPVKGFESYKQFDWQCIWCMALTSLQNYMPANNQTSFPIPTQDQDPAKDTHRLRIQSFQATEDSRRRMVSRSAERARLMLIQALSVVLIEHRVPVSLNLLAAIPCTDLQEPSWIGAPQLREVDQENLWIQKMAPLLVRILTAVRVHSLCRRGQVALELAMQIPQDCHIQTSHCLARWKRTV